MFPITIITINLNNAKALQQTIDSVLKQTVFSQIEYIIVDGASKDASVSILNTLNQSNVIGISEPDHGAFHAMNKGTQTAHGKYLLFLNSGDILCDQYVIQNCINYTNNNYDLLIGNEYSNLGQIFRAVPLNLSLEHILTYSLPHQSVLIKREWQLQHPYDEYCRIHGDGKFFIESIFYQQASYEILPLFISIFDMSGISKTNPNLKALERIYAYESLINKYKDQDSKLLQYSISNTTAQIQSHDIYDMKVDLVIPYVDSSQTQWQTTLTQKYPQYNIVNRMNRDFNLFKYTFRAIARSMPGINNVFLLVQDETQVPTWLDTKQIKVILHKDFIPATLLPTYNSNTIEMFLKDIPGLSEYFIYSNDDIIPTGPLSMKNFFTSDKKPIIELKPTPVAAATNNNGYAVMVKKNHDIVQQYLKRDEYKKYFLIGNHNMFPMTKTICSEVLENFKKEISTSLTPFRNRKNITPDIYKIGGLYTNQIIPSVGFKAQFVSMSDKPDTLQQFKFQLRDNQSICLNDSLPDDIDIQYYHTLYDNILKEIYPLPCKYEK